jgi:hypothetical protein
MYRTVQANSNSDTQNCIYVRATEHKQSVERRVPRHFGITRTTDLADLTDRVDELIEQPLSSSLTMLSSTPREQCTCHCHGSRVLDVEPVETVASIEEEIERAKDRIHVLRRRRNALLPIGRLPLEILCKDFESYKSAYSPREWSPRLLNLTHVSSAWRSVLFITLDHHSSRAIETRPGKPDIRKGTPSQYMVRGGLDCPI